MVAVDKMDAHKVLKGAPVRQRRRVLVVQKAENVVDVPPVVVPKHHCAEQRASFNVQRQLHLGA